MNIKASRKKIAPKISIRVMAMMSISVGNIGQPRNARVVEI